jgi:hypothetical protein
VISLPFNDFGIFAVSSYCCLFTWSKGLVEVLKREVDFTS